MSQDRDVLKFVTRFQDGEFDGQLVEAIGMNKMDKRFRELLEEYRVALGFFSGLRVQYAATSPKVVESTKHLAKLEQALANYNEPMLVA